MDVDAVMEAAVWIRGRCSCRSSVVRREDQSNCTEKIEGGMDRLLWGVWFRGRERCAWRKPVPDRRGKRPCESAMPYAVDEHLAW